MTPDDIVDRVLRWLKEVESATGRVPIISTSNSWLRQRAITGDNAASLNRYPLWVLDYSSAALTTGTPSSPNGRNWKLWGMTETGRIANASLQGNIDVHVFNGTPEEFRNFK